MLYILCFVNFFAFWFIQQGYLVFHRWWWIFDFFRLDWFPFTASLRHFHLSFKSWFHVCKGLKFFSFQLLHFLKFWFIYIFTLLCCYVRIVLRLCRVKYNIIWKKKALTLRFWKNKIMMENMLDRTVLGLVVEIFAAHSKFCNLPFKQCCPVPVPHHWNCIILYNSWLNFYWLNKVFWSVKEIWLKWVLSQIWFPDGNGNKNSK